MQNHVLQTQACCVTYLIGSSKTAFHIKHTVDIASYQYSVTLKFGGPVHPGRIFVLLSCSSQVMGIILRWHQHIEA